MQISGPSASVSQVPGLPSQSRLLAVWCESATSCLAIGSTGVAGHYSATAATLSGATWSFAAVPGSPSVVPPYQALGCTSSTSCEVVGADGAASLAGTTWSLDNPPLIDGPPLSSLAGLACPYAGHCIGVGSFSSPTQSGLPYVETQNADTWSLSFPAPPAGAVSAELTGVSCPGPHDCVAAGTWTDATGGTHPYIDQMSRGIWTAIPLSVPGTIPAPRGTDLSGISCTADTECVAVGASIWGAGGGQTDCGTCGSQSIAAVLIGSTWKVSYLQGPFNPANAAMLTSVSCWSARHCDAVGVFWPYGQQGSKGLVETLDGVWRPVGMPSPSQAVDVSLNGISCAAANSCEVVGGFERSANAPGQFPLFATGAPMQPWVLDRPSSKPAPVGTLEAIACLAPTTCAAVGETGTGALTATLSNGQWDAAIAVPPVGYDAASLSSISCLPFAGCESVGSATDGAASVPVWAIP